MRVKYFAGKIQHDFFQFDDLPTSGRSERGGTSETAPAEAPPTRADSTHNQQHIQGGIGGQLHPAAAERATTAGDHQRRTGCRTATPACRIAAPKGFTRTGAGLYPVYQQPPYSPPKAMQEPPAIPAKSHSRSNQHSRQAPQRPGQDRDTEATAETGTATAAATSQHSTTTAAPNQHNSRTAQPQAGRTSAPTTATGPTMTTGPARRAVGTPARLSSSAGAEAQNFFRFEVNFFTSPCLG